jgi:hypothetical protein
MNAPFFFAMSRKQRYNSTMKLLRILIAAICCLCFASASMAGTMPCCKGQQAAATEQHAMPCHADMQQPTKQHKPVSAKSCNCVCSVSAVVIPVPSPPLRSAVITHLPQFVVSMHSYIPALLDAPPKTIS